MDKIKLLNKVLGLKEMLKSSKTVYEKDLENYTFYNKNNLKDYYVMKGRVIDSSYIEFSMHLPKEVDLNKEIFFMDDKGTAYTIEKDTIRTTYKEISLKGKIDQHPVTTCKYHKVKLLITD